MGVEHLAHAACRARASPRRRAAPRGRPRASAMLAGDGSPTTRVRIRQAWYWRQTPANSRVSWSAGSSLRRPDCVAAEQRIAAGADDERVARIVAAAPEDRILHRGQDVALVGARAGSRAIAASSAASASSAARRTQAISAGDLTSAQPVDQVRRVGEPWRSRRARRRPACRWPRSGRSCRIRPRAACPPGPCRRAARTAAWPGRLSARSTQMRMSSSIEVCCAWRRSGARVSSARSPSARSTRHWKKQ